jgi:hypothetical protein
MEDITRGKKHLLFQSKESQENVSTKHSPKKKTSYCEIYILSSVISRLRVGFRNLKKINFAVIEIFVALVLCNLDHHFPRQLLLPSCANPRDLLEDFEVLGRIRQFGKSIPADPLDALVHFRNFWFCQHHLHGPIARRHRISGYYSVGEDPFFPGPPFHLLPFL